MNIDNYVPKNINSKNDIALYLENNIECYKEEAKSLLDNSNFNDIQKNYIEDIMIQFYYAINDLSKAIQILNKQ